MAPVRSATPLFIAALLLAACGKVHAARKSPGKTRSLPGAPSNIDVNRTHPWRGEVLPIATHAIVQFTPPESPDCMASAWMASATPIWPWKWVKKVRSATCEEGSPIVGNSTDGPTVHLEGLNPSLRYVFQAWVHTSCGAGATANFTEPDLNMVYEGPVDPFTSSFHVVDTSLPASKGFKWLKKAQKSRAQMLNVVVENGQLEVDYKYCENLDDGRGFTFGRSGFCTGTGDGLLLTQLYMALKPNNNPLAKYLNALLAINSTGNGLNDDITGLGGFCKVVKTSSKDPLFQKAQDQLNDELYYKKSQRTAAHYGMALPLTKGQMYDTWINQGFYPPGDIQYPDSANGLVDWTNEYLGGSPGEGVDERLWLKTYLARRWWILAKKDRTWAESVGRVLMYNYLVNAEQWQLNQAIALKGGCCGASGLCKKTKDAANSVAISGLVYGSFKIK